MFPKKRLPTHPGVILREEFLAPLGASPATFAAHLGVPHRRVSEILRGKRDVRADTAWRLAGALGTTPEFWMKLQTAHDLAVSRPTKLVRRLKAAT